LSWSVEIITSTPSPANETTRSSSGAEESRLRPECTWKSAAIAFLVAMTRFSRKSTGAIWPAVTVTRLRATPYSGPRVT
jgi:hypothetical protein